MQKNGMYKSANPWGLVETTKELLLDENIQNLITFSWFGEKEDPYIQEQTCYTCPHCKLLIVDFFRNINMPTNIKELLGHSLSDDELKAEGAPTERLLEFFLQLHEECAILNSVWEGSV